MPENYFQKFQNWIDTGTWFKFSDEQRSIANAKLEDEIKAQNLSIMDTMALRANINNKIDDYFNKSTTQGAARAMEEAAKTQAGGGSGESPPPQTKMTSPDETLGEIGRRLGWAAAGGVSGGLSGGPWGAGAGALIMGAFPPPEGQEVSGALELALMPWLGGKLGRIANKVKGPKMRAVTAGTMGVAEDFLSENLANIEHHVRQGSGVDPETGEPRGLNVVPPSPLGSVISGGSAATLGYLTGKVGRSPAIMEAKAIKAAGREPFETNVVEAAQEARARGRNSVQENLKDIEGRRLVLEKEHGKIRDEYENFQRSTRAKKSGIKSSTSELQTKYQESLNDVRAKIADLDADAVVLTGEQQRLAARKSGRLNTLRTNVRNMSMKAQEADVAVSARMRETRKELDIVKWEIEDLKPEVKEMVTAIRTQKPLPPAAAAFKLFRERAKAKNHNLIVDFGDVPTYDEVFMAATELVEMEDRARQLKTQLDDMAIHGAMENLDLKHEKRYATSTQNRSAAKFLSDEETLVENVTGKKVTKGQLKSVETRLQGAMTLAEKQKTEALARIDETADLIGEEWGRVDQLNKSRLDSLAEQEKLITGNHNLQQVAREKTISGLYDTLIDGDKQVFDEYITFLREHEGTEAIDDLREGLIDHMLGRPKSIDETSKLMTPLVNSLNYNLTIDKLTTLFGSRAAATDFRDLVIALSDRQKELSKAGTGMRLATYVLHHMVFFSRGLTPKVAGIGGTFAVDKISNIAEKMAKNRKFSRQFIRWMEEGATASSLKYFPLVYKYVRDETEQVDALDSEASQP